MTDDRLARIGRLAAVAQGLEREGGYNGAKLLRAAMERDLVRHARSAAPVGASALSDAVRAIRDEAAAGDPRLAAALDAIAVEAGRGGTPSIEIAPRALTCRQCGHLFLGPDLPDACPDCEAPAASFKEHVPVWYLEPAETAGTLVLLEEGAARVGRALEGRSDAELDRRPAPGEWSARETLEHLLFAEELFAQRVERLLTEDEPDLVARAVWMETPTSDEGTVATGEPASVLVRRYQALRTATIDRLRALEPAGWDRSGWHPEWGRVSVSTQAGYFARHEASHTAQLVAAAAGRLPGRG